MTPARKRRIWERDDGLCWRCREPVPMTGPDVRYDHRIQLWMTWDDSDEAISPSHTQGCDQEKTAQDATDRAKVKRLQKKNAPGYKPAGTIKSKGFGPSRGFEKSRRKIPSRPMRS